MAGICSPFRPSSTCPIVFLNRAISSLAKPANNGQQPPYFLSYSVTEGHTLEINAQFGAIVSSSVRDGRIADVVVRVGDELGYPDEQTEEQDHRGEEIGCERVLDAGEDGCGGKEEEDAGRDGPEHPAGSPASPPG